jgi:hypothetical protein
LNKWKNDVSFFNFLQEDPSIQGDPWWKEVDLNRKLNEQITMETDQKAKIQSINTSKPIDEKLVRFY